MKVLFIGSSKYDYLQDLTYNGLVKVLGRRSVVEAKTVFRYHFPLKKYPKDLGYDGIDLSFLTKSPPIAGLSPPSINTVFTVGDNVGNSFS